MKRDEATYWIDIYNEISWVVAVVYETNTQLVGPFPTCELAYDYIGKCGQKHKDLADLFGNGGKPDFEVRRMGMPTNR